MIKSNPRTLINDYDAIPAKHIMDDTILTQLSQTYQQSPSARQRRGSARSGKSLLPSTWSGCSPGQTGGDPGPCPGCWSPRVGRIRENRTSCCWSGSHLWSTWPINERDKNSVKVWVKVNFILLRYTSLSPIGRVYSSIPFFTLITDTLHNLVLKTSNLGHKIFIPLADTCNQGALTSNKATKAWEI